MISLMYSQKIMVIFNLFVKLYKPFSIHDQSIYTLFISNYPFDYILGIKYKIMAN